MHDETIVCQECELPTNLYRPSIQVIGVKHAGMHVSALLKCAGAVHAHHSSRRNLSVIVLRLSQTCWKFIHWVLFLPGKLTVVAVKILVVE